MTGNEILKKRLQLEDRLNLCLSTMEKKDDIHLIRAEMKKLEQQCPHQDAELNFALIDGCCPYCGGKVCND